MSVEGIWIAELQRQVRPDGNPSLAPLFTMVVRRDGNALTARMFDGRGDFLAASAVQTWRGVATDDGAKLELPVRYVTGGRMGDFRLLYIDDDVRQIANGRALVRRLELSVEGDTLRGRWLDFWYVADRKDGGLSVEVVPRPAVFSAQRSDRPIRWVGPDGPDPQRVTSGATLTPRLQHGGSVIDTLQALIAWPGNQRPVDIETGAVLLRGDGPPIHVRVHDRDAPGREQPGSAALPIAGEPPIVVRVAPGATVTASAFGHTARVVVDARNDTRRLTIVGVEVDQTAAQRRWAQAIAPLQSLRDDRIGDVTALEDRLESARATQAEAEAAFDRADAALTSINRTRRALIEAVETRLGQLRGQPPLSNIEKHLLDNEAALRNTRARLKAPGQSGPAPAESKREIEAYRTIIREASDAIRAALTQDPALNETKTKIAAYAKERQAAARALSAAARVEQEARDDLRDVAFDLSMARTAATIARGRTDGLDGRGPRLVHAQFTTGDGVVFDAGTAPDPTLVEHFRAVLTRAESDRDARQRDLDDAREIHQACADARARARRRMLDAFDGAQEAGEDVADTILFNARLRQGLHWAVDVAELGWAAKSGALNLTYECAFKLLGFAAQGGRQQTQMFDESALRDSFEEVYAQKARAQAAGRTTDAGRTPAKGGIEVPYHSSITPELVAISTLKATGMASYGQWKVDHIEIPARDAERRAAIERARKLEARLGPQPNITGGLAPREEVIDTLRARASAHQGIMGDWERELAAARGAEQVDPARVQRAQKGLQRARADFDSSRETVDRLKRRLASDRAGLREANKASRKAGDLLDEALEKRKTLKGRGFLTEVGKGVAVDIAVAAFKDWVNNQLDETEAQAWQYAFDTEVVYAAAVMANRRAHEELWSAEAARLEAKRALHVAALRLAAHRARLDAYLAGQSAASGQLPVRHSVAFETDASPLTLRLTAAGGPLGVDAQLSDTRAPAESPGIAQSAAPEPTPIPIDSEMAAQLIPRMYAVSAAALERFEDERTLNLRLVVR